MKLGIIGLAGSGRSTLFGAMTGGNTTPARAKKESMAVVRVPDERVDFLAEQFQPKKISYAQVEYLLPGDVATGDTGKGRLEGLCNQVRACDALIQVVRNFGGNGVGEACPEDDLGQVEQEMIFSDFMVVEKRIERIGWEKQRGKPVNAAELDLLKSCQEVLENDTPIRRHPELATEPLLRGYALVSAKPKLVLFNNEDEDDALPRVNGAGSGEVCLAVRGKIESELAGMGPEDAKEFLSDFGIQESAMHRVIRRSYDLLGLVSFFTVGEDEVKAWTVRRDTRAVDAAAAIHSDIKKGFIRAEVVSYDDLRETGSLAEARKKGKMRLEGKEYPVQDGDIINFRFNV